MFSTNELYGLLHHKAIHRPRIAGFQKLENIYRKGMTAKQARTKLIRVILFYKRPEAEGIVTRPRYAYGQARGERLRSPLNSSLVT